MLKEIDSNPGTVIGYIRDADVFTSIAESAIARLAGYGRLYQAPVGTEIVKEGVASPMLCLIVQGSVDIVKELGEPEPRTVANLSAGKTLGEMSLIDNLPFSATAVVEEEALLFIFSKESLDKLADDEPAIYNRIICGLSKQISERLRHTTDVLASHLSQTAELTDALNEALRSAQSRSGFIADMSHQMRTPLNAIVGFAELLEDDIASGDIESTKSDVSSIRQACETMNRLVVDILDLSKIEAGQIKLQLEEIGIHYLLQELATSIAPRIEQRGNRLRIQCPEDIGVIKADEVQLRQILVNLLENACTHTEQGEITLSASLREGDNGQWLVFRVSDTGRGMSQQQIDNLFNRFSKSDSTVRAKYGGTGLGLAISQSLCKMFGGRIEVSSERGKGTEFSVWLPRVPMLDQAATG